MRHIYQWALLTFALLFTVTFAGAKGNEDTMQRRSVPASGRITLTDYGYRDWGPELVQYTVDATKFHPGALVLLDNAGKSVPFQINGNILSYVVSVPKGGTVTYTLQASPKDRAAENTTLACAVQGDTLEIHNEYLAVRMPAPGQKTYDPPVNAATVPAPIAQWNAQGQGWIGGAHFATARKIASSAFSIIRQGPAVVEYEARYRFAPQGEYVWRLRLSPGMPLAIVTEEFDMGAITKGDDLLVLELHRGWQPKHIGWVPGSGEQLLPKLIQKNYADYLDDKKKGQATQASVGGVGTAPAPPMPGAGMMFLEPMTPAGRWGANKGGVHFWDGDAPGTGANIGVVTLSDGSWRRSMAMDTWYRQDAGMVLSLPLSVRNLSWALEVTDDLSPFSSHEHDPGLPESYGRRVWGLYIGPTIEQAQARFGFIGLDRYKDWIIDMPEGSATKGAYPGALFRADLVERLRKSIDQHPQADWLKQRYLISRKTSDAIANAQEVIDRLKKPYDENDFFVIGLTNYRKTQLLMFANRAEDALACPDLPLDLRQELRRRLTLYAYVVSDPDWNPRGAGVHLGNNNMPVNRTLSLSLFAPLLPDHPRYAYWMEQIRAYTTFKLTTQTAPDGVDLECPSYHLYAPAQAINISLNALSNRGFDTRELKPYFKGKLTWLANLTMPDPRYHGARIIPGMGNSSNLQESIWGITMATFADDPKFAGWLKYIFELSGKRIATESTDVTCVGHAMYYLPDAQDTTQPLATTFLPTYGVAFRNHFNTPNETAMLFRAGMNWGHWDTDALNTILYAKGAPLSPGTGYQYYSGPATQNNAIYHNQVKIGKRDTQECFGRVDAAVTDYGFGANADYAVASRFYPSQIFQDNKGPVNWNRHVLFLKSALPDGNDYFVLRDTFSGSVRQSWWTWMNLDTPDLITVDGTAFDPAKTPLEKVVPESTYPSLHGQTVEMKTKYGASTWFYFSEAHDVRLSMIFKAAGETKTIVDIPGAVGLDYFYTVFPRKDGAPAPICTTLAPGVMKIQTAEATDIVFLGDTPFNWNRDGVTFTGKAGVVRIFADHVALCMNAGNGKIGYKGYVVEGFAPFEREVKLSALKPAVLQLHDGYEKTMMTVNIGQGVRVYGEGPFSATLDGETIHIKTSGRTRVLHVTRPPFLVHPEYYIDGKEYMACWTDYPNNGWGSYDQTWLVGLTIPEGTHELTLKNKVFPVGWTRPFIPLIGVSTK